MTTLTDLELNDLVYLADSDPSRAIQRQMAKIYSEKNVYSQEQRIIFKVHGNQLRDFSNSSLRILFSPSGGQASFGDVQSAVCLFNRVRVLTPAGEAISDVQNLNLFDVINTKLKESVEYEKILGQSYGGNATGSTGNGVIREYVIPLCKLSPYFNNKQLTPPQIANGMIIEFYLESSAIAYNATAPTTYTISNPELLLDSVNLSSDALAAVMSMGQKGSDALVYEFTDVVESQTFSPSTDSELFFDIPQSCTNGLEAFAVLRNTATQIQNAYSFDCLGPTVLPAPIDNNDQLEWQIGSTKLPRQRAIGGAQIYQIAAHSQGALSDKSMSNFSLAYDTEYTTRYGCYAVDLRTSKIFHNSGREVSNAQRLNVFIKYHQALDLICNVFLYHVARVVVSDGNMTVER